MTRVQTMMCVLAIGCMLVPLNVLAQYYPQPYPDPYQQQPQTGTTYDPYGGFQQHIPGQVPSASVPTVTAPRAQVPSAYEMQMVPPQVPPGYMPPHMIQQGQMAPGQILPVAQPLPPMQTPAVPADNGVNVYRVIKNGDTTYINRRRIIDPNNMQSDVQPAPQPGDIIDPALQQGNAMNPNAQNPVVNCYIPAGVVGTHVSTLQNLSVNNPVRILGPNSQATMDFSPSRTNFIVDEDQIVVGARCG